MRQFEDLESRKRVWIALSNLFLDTDVSLLTESTAQELASSPYSLDDLEEILTTEIYPVCKYNLWNLAGEWAGFDEDWLVERVSKKRGHLSRLWNSFFARIGTVTSSDWKQVKARVRIIRDQNDA